ncbi:type II secretion system F family protein [Zavarzinella formosa]|uniref:type II secretion system F family protein n=1 Tax=Zavarzinella formosa TaxID=360055 RepID=UPI000301059C|nr:type II secretion system F family protein [Zavarzinella formosa]
MFSNPMLTATITFFATSLVVLVINWHMGRKNPNDRDRTSERIRELCESNTDHPVVKPSVPLLRRLVTAVSMLGTRTASARDERMQRLRGGLLRAGYYSATAPQFFLGAMLMMAVILTLAGGVAVFCVKPGNIKFAALGGVGGGLLGLAIPMLWVSERARQRQRLLTIAVPDALDMLVLCLEGGTSINAAVQRVADELHVVHPLLGMEINIVQREMQMGLSPGEAFQKFADRCGLLDVRELAMAIVQSERCGAGIAKALRTYAESARHRCQQKAEETAQRAAVKILMPTMLCIFPAIFIVVLGPAAYQTANMFAR